MIETPARLASQGSSWEGAATLNEEDLKMYTLLSLFFVPTRLGRWSKMLFILLLVSLSAVCETALATSLDDAGGFRGIKLGTSRDSITDLFKSDTVEGAWHREGDRLSLASVPLNEIRYTFSSTDQLSEILLFSRTIFDHVTEDEDYVGAGEVHTIEWKHDSHKVFELLLDAFSQEYPDAKQVVGPEWDQLRRSYHLALSNHEIQIARVSAFKGDLIQVDFVNLEDLRQIDEDTRRCPGYVMVRFRFIPKDEF